VDQNEASAIARSLLANADGLYKIGVDAGASTLWLRFYFPDAVQHRIAEQLAEIEAQTGWSVRIHPSVHQEALVAAARRLIPAGLTLNGTPSLYHDRRAVGLTCKGSVSKEAIEEAQRQFREETGWELELMVPAVEGDESTWLPQGEAMALAASIFKEAHDLYRVGVDTKRRTLWLHFHFPAVVRKRYAGQLAALAEQSGWHVDLHPTVHQKALIDAACRLLPDSLNFTGKASIRLDRHILNLTCTGEVSKEEIQEVRRKFAEETGWHLEILNRA
jgi:hypothetical protein